jgi:hypothetical protein
MDDVTNTLLNPQSTISAHGLLRSSEHRSVSGGSSGSTGRFSTATVNAGDVSTGPPMTSGDTASTTIPNVLSTDHLVDAIFPAGPPRLEAVLAAVLVGVER